MSWGVLIDFEVMVGCGRSPRSTTVLILLKTIVALRKFVMSFSLWHGKGNPSAVVTPSDFIPSFCKQCRRFVDDLDCLQQKFPMFVPNCSAIYHAYDMNSYDNHRVCNNLSTLLTNWSWPLGFVLRINYNINMWILRLMTLSPRFIIVLMSSIFVASL